MERERRDLSSRAAVHDLVVAFYRELAMDDLLGPAFEEVAEVDWTEHIPLLIDLVPSPPRRAAYHGSIPEAHRRVHLLQAFRPELFDRWYALFVQSVDERWSGPLADKAKEHAGRIASSLARQLPRIEWCTPAAAQANP